MQNLYKRALEETYDREIQVLLDKQLFMQVDTESTGRLTYDQFKELLNIRRDMMTKELGDQYYDFTEEEHRKRYEFACNIAESSDGPTLRTFDKWMIMFRYLVDQEIEEAKELEE